MESVSPTNMISNLHLEVVPFVSSSSESSRVPFRLSLQVQRSAKKAVRQIVPLMFALFHISSAFKDNFDMGSSRPVAREHRAAFAEFPFYRHFNR